MNDEHRVGRLECTDVDLDLLFAQINQLHRLASDADAAQDGDKRYDFSIRWGVLLSGRLQRLLHYESRGELSAGERERFQELRNQLEDAAPVARKLGMADPVSAIDTYGGKKHAKR